MPAEVISTLLLAFSIVAVFALLLIVLGLISKVRKDRKKFDQFAPVEALRPFPQTVTYPTGVHLPQVAADLSVQTVRDAYADWLKKLLLPDQEPGQSFVRMGVEKHNLRFQVLTTSFGQALALLFSVVMAGDDLFAHQRFERLLAFCLSHPAADQGDLSSWQSLPDNRSARRQEADPHAEAWIALSLLAAREQWHASERFNLPIVLQNRLAGLDKLYNTRQQLEPQPYLLSSPAFLKAFAQATGDPKWRAISKSLDGQATNLITREGLSLTGSESVEQSQLALQVLNFGLDALWNGGDAQRDLSGKLLQIARQTVERFDPHAKADFSVESQGKFGALAQVACCAPVVMTYGDQNLVDQLWSKLTSVETSKFDPMGVSLRLLALMLLSGVMWPLSDNWQPTPPETSV